MALEIFLTRFYKEHNELISDLDSFGSKNSTKDLNSLTSEYEKISNRIQLLQNFFNEHVSHISLYEQRKAQEHLSKLNTHSAQIRSDLFPKKKFTFKSKKNLTTASKLVEETEIRQQEQQNEKVEEDKSLDNLARNHTCTIQDCSDQTIVKSESELLNADVGIINVKNCVIKLYGNPSVIHINNIENTVILCGPLSGTAFVNKCINSKLNLTCHQLRIHESIDTDFYINVSSRTIIENCKRVRFAPYAWTCRITKKLEDIGDNWRMIDDFNWLVLNQKSPNWSFIEENERLKWIDSDENREN